MVKNYIFDVDGTLTDSRQRMDKNLLYGLVNFVRETMYI